MLDKNYTPNRKDKCKWAFYATVLHPLGGVFFIILFCLFVIWRTYIICRHSLTAGVIKTICVVFVYACITMIRHVFITSNTHWHTTKTLGTFQIQRNIFMCVKIGWKRKTITFGAAERSKANVLAEASETNNVNSSFAIEFIKPHFFLEYIDNHSILFVAKANQKSFIRRWLGSDLNENWTISLCACFLLAFATP